ncbi:hypothetical protein [uncultured Nocardioides sp.]|uniref:hypothetical protein n=1 Tax=uncultured Nocardioides sp. TaxID=198441 RepID=UPI002601846B|nr:hypothetical protein [uncultured Nocardioides sp.]
MSMGSDDRPSAPDREGRRAQAQAIIDQILHGTPDGRVNPAVAENLRGHLAANPGEPDRALLAHLQDQIPGLNAVLPEDLT